MIASRSEDSGQTTEVSDRHTPAPWFVNRYRATIQTHDPSKPSLHYIHTLRNRPICYLEVGFGYGAMPKTSDADAALIAAAPELLEVAQLVTLTPLQHGISIPEELMRLAEAAIAKAERA